MSRERERERERESCISASATEPGKIQQKQLSPPSPLAPQKSASRSKQWLFSTPSPDLEYPHTRFSKKFVFPWREIILSSLHVRRASWQRKSSIRDQSNPRLLSSVIRSAVMEDCLTFSRFLKSARIVFTQIPNDGFSGYFSGTLQSPCV